MSVKQFQFAISLLGYCEDGTTDEQLATMTKSELSAWITATVSRRDEMRRSRNEQAIAEIKQFSLLDYISHDLNFRKAGTSHKALCPFHEENTPSFTVTESTNLFQCFGCRKAGDIFSYVQERDGVSFIDALKILADYGRIDLGDDVDIADIERKSTEKAPSQKLKTKKPSPTDDELNQAVNRSWRDLERNRAGSQDYLISRGITIETARANKVGYMWVGGHDSVSFPLYVLDGMGKNKLKSYNRRIYLHDVASVREGSDENKKPKKPPKTMLKNGAESGLFLTCDYKNASTLIVIEGEINALSIWQIGKEHINVIGLTGKGYFKSLADEIHESARRHEYTHVVFWGDIDKDESERNNTALAARNRAIYELDAELSHVAFKKRDANNMLLSGDLGPMLDEIAPFTPPLSPNRDLESWGASFGTATVTDLLPTKPLGTPIVPMSPTGEFPSEKPEGSDFDDFFDTNKADDCVGDPFHEWVWAMRAVRSGHTEYLEAARKHALAISDKLTRLSCLAETTINPPSSSDWMESEFALSPHRQKVLI